MCGCDLFLGRSRRWIQSEYEKGLLTIEKRLLRRSNQNYSNYYLAVSMIFQLNQNMSTHFNFLSGNAFSLLSISCLFATARCQWSSVRGIGTRHAAAREVGLVTVGAHFTSLPPHNKSSIWRTLLSVVIFKLFSNKCTIYHKWLTAEYVLVVFVQHFECEGATTDLDRRLLWHLVSAITFVYPDIRQWESSLERGLGSR